MGARYLPGDRSREITQLAVKASLVLSLIQVPTLSPDFVFSFIASISLSLNLMLTRTLFSPFLATVFLGQNSFA